MRRRRLPGIFRPTGEHPPDAPPSLPPLAGPATFWNFEPCTARKVTLTVADSEFFPAYWARPYVGMTRHAVEVTYNGAVFYLDDDPDTDAEQDTLDSDAIGPGWAKVTIGRGSPRYGHRELEPEEGSVKPR